MALAIALVILVLPFALLFFHRQMDTREAKALARKPLKSEGNS